jgi:Holliday junction resolvase
MEIKKKYLSKYLHDIAIEQIAEEYYLKGFTVSREERLGKYIADLIVRKGNEQIVIEVKSGKLTPQKKEQISKIADFVREVGGYKFIVVVATPPKEKKLEILEINELLFNYFIEDGIPDELDLLSTHTTIDEIVDVDIDEISINGKSILIKGDGVVSVELQYGSDGDQLRNDGFKTTDNYPFEFELTLEYNLNKELEIVDVSELTVDTSSFYE